MSSHRIAHRTCTALLLLAALCACGEERHYSVNLRGEARRVDADGNPLPGQALPDFGMHAGPLVGTVRLDPATTADPARFTCIFLMAKRIGSDAEAMPEAVARVEHPTFPLEFTLGADAGHGAGLSPGEYRVMAWLDSDGDAGRQPGDIIGQAREPASPGGRPVQVVLDHVLTADDVGPAAGATAPPFATAPAGAEPLEAELPGPRFRGTIELASDFAELDGRHSLFIMLRSPQTEGGMPLAVKRIDGARFPLTFDVGTEDVPLDVDNKAEIIAGQVKITARLSVSGKLTGGAGDVESAPLITGPAEGLVLRLDTRRAR